MVCMEWTFETTYFNFQEIVLITGRIHKTLALSQELCVESQPLCKQKERREDKVQGGNPLFKCQAVRANPSLQLSFPLFCTSQGSDTPRPSLFRHLLYVRACGCDCARATTCIALHQWGRARRTYDSKKAARGRDGGRLEKTAQVCTSSILVLCYSKSTFCFGNWQIISINTFYTFGATPDGRKKYSAFKWSTHLQLWNIY